MTERSILALYGPPDLIGFFFEIIFFVNVFWHMIAKSNFEVLMLQNGIENI